MLNKVVIFVLFPYKKYSRRFITVRLNHWWQMEYPGDDFHTFLGLDSVNYLAVYGTATSLLVLTQNILNCVLKMNKAFTGLERHGGVSEELQNYHFGVEYPFTLKREELGLCSGCVAQVHIGGPSGCALLLLISWLLAAVRSHPSPSTPHMSR